MSRTTNPVSPPIKFTAKQQFVDALEACRPWAEAQDKAITATHRKAEQEVLTKFRARCRELAKLGYDELRELEQNGGYGATRAEFDSPQCPISEVARLDAVLKTLSLSHQEAFTVDSDGWWRTAHYFLTVTDTPATVC